MPGRGDAALSSAAEDTSQEECTGGNTSAELLESSLEMTMGVSWSSYVEDVSGPHPHRASGAWQHWLFLAIP